jgi:Co/Zn/Cd efflux system component
MKQDDKEFLGALTTMAVLAAISILLIVQAIFRIWN